MTTPHELRTPVIPDDAGRPRVTNEGKRTPVLSERRRVRAAFGMSPELAPFVFGPDERTRLSALLDIDIDDPRGVQAADAAASDVELLITGWGAPILDERALNRFPSLRAIVHWGGGIDFLNTAAAARRELQVSSGRWANAIPVAEYTVAMITLAAKGAFGASELYRREQRFIDREAEFPHTGLAGTNVGIIGASTIGALVIKKLQDYDVQVLVYDPFLPAPQAEELGVELIDDLRELARRSRILSIHAPDIPQTRRMVSRSVLASLPDDATLINTARGALVDQGALVDELSTGRISAVLDVTEPDVLPVGHPLYALPNVFLTPHLAGSMGNELRRLGASAVREVERFVAGTPFAHAIPTHAFLPLASHPSSEPSSARAE
ncbi:hydroxyacid dehydrogenase [Microbacterium sp. LWS13-1.2]|uniref:Hydroxyacid dehydrogenase n=1 Tax=Microbacterium sp. LWS13-1.2 TaxID=3135264 RepID=A0AAU6SE11_9MICO